MAPPVGAARAGGDGRRRGVEQGEVEPGRPEGGARVGAVTSERAQGGGAGRRHKAGRRRHPVIGVGVARRSAGRRVLLGATREDVPDGVHGALFVQPTVGEVGAGRRCGPLASDDVGAGVQAAALQPRGRLQHGVAAHDEAARKGVGAREGGDADRAPRLSPRARRAHAAGDQSRVRGRDGAGGVERRPGVGRRQRGDSHRIGAAGGGDGPEGRRQRRRAEGRPAPAQTLEGIGHSGAGEVGGPRRRGVVGGDRRAGQGEGHQRRRGEQGDRGDQQGGQKGKALPAAQGPWVGAGPRPRATAG